VAFAFTRLVSSGWFVAAALIVAGACCLTVALVRTAISVGAWVVAAKRARMTLRRSIRNSQSAIRNSLDCCPPRKTL
jgi:hypothetical protein